MCSFFGGSNYLFACPFHYIRGHPYHRCYPWPITTPVQGHKFLILCLLFIISCFFLLIIDFSKSDIGDLRPFRHWCRKPRAGCDGVHPPPVSPEVIHIRPLQGHKFLIRRFLFIIPCFFYCLLDIHYSTLVIRDQFRRRGRKPPITIAGGRVRGAPFTRGGVSRKTGILTPGYQYFTPLGCRVCFCALLCLLWYRFFLFALNSPYGYVQILLRTLNTLHEQILTPI